MKLIVMAGGQGTKLWPMSRESAPKQFQAIVGDKTLFRTNIEALLKGFTPDDIFVSTKEQYLEFVKKDAPELPERNIILEPNIKKNQGPATGYAALKVAHYYPDEPFMLIQSDCLRIPDDKFIEMIKGADKLVNEDHKLITGGARPLFPIMGCDYLKLGEKIKNSNGLEIYHVDEFIPRLDDYNKTKTLISNFHVSIHSNHYCWFIDDLMNAFKTYRPNWYEKLNEIKETFGKPNEKEETERIYNEFEEGPIEDVTKEIFAKEGNVILMPFKWTDIGTWGSIYEYFAKHEEVYADGDSVNVDSKNTFIKGKKGKIIATIGVENLVIVDTDDALLVCRKDRAGEIKKVLDGLKNNKLEKYL